MKALKHTLNGWLLTGALLLSLLIPTAAIVQQPPVKNIVLVHGAFVDGSRWKGVYDRLTKKGYHVSIVQEPLTSYTADVAVVKRVLARMNGPVILVGHSYGGTVITEAGNDPHVAGLVYIAAHAPDAGENEAANGVRYPPAYKSLVKGTDGFDYIDPTRFAADFAGGVHRDLAGFMSYSQVPTADSAFHAIIKNPARRIKPSWYMVAKADRIINPDLERMYAKRANSHTVEIDGASHSVFLTHPKEVTGLIIEAASDHRRRAGTHPLGQRPARWPEWYAQRH